MTDNRSHHPAVHYMDDVRSNSRDYDRRTEPRIQDVRVLQTPTGWRVVWQIEPSGDASWEFASEDDARKAAKIIRGWKHDVR